MPFMNVAEAYAFKNHAYNPQSVGRGARANKVIWDWDLSSMYTNINKGLTRGQLNMMGSPSNSGKSNISWMAHYMATQQIIAINEALAKEAKIKIPDIMNIEDGNISELLKMHDKTMNTISMTIQLWELLLSVFDWKIEPDSMNARQFNRQQEYFQVNDKRYAVRYSTSEIKISVQEDADSLKAKNIIELRHPQSNKIGGLYALDRWRFHRDAILGPDIVAYDPNDKNRTIPVLEASDMEAYLFQESLVHERLNTTMAECLGSSCEDRIPYNFHTLDMNLEYLVPSEERDDFSIIIGLIIAEQRARMLEYGERTSSLAHSIRVRSKFGPKEFNFE